MNSELILFADVGNSRTKIKLEKNKVIAFNNEDDKWDELIDKNLEGKKVEALYYSSVNEKAELQLLKKIFEYTRNTIDVNDLLKKSSPINSKGIKGIGSDRIMSMIGALNIANTPLITVDCGTAVTINLLDERSNCLGGVIFSGFFSQSKALNEYTFKLPMVDRIKDDSYIGTNTNDALNYGILNSIVGGVRETIIHSTFSSAPDIVVTGGYGYQIKERLMKHFPNVKYDRYLVLKGVESLAVSVPV